MTLPLFPTLQGPGDAPLGTTRAARDARAPGGCSGS